MYGKGVWEGVCGKEGVGRMRVGRGVGRCVWEGECGKEGEGRMRVGRGVVRVWVRGVRRGCGKRCMGSRVWKGG